VSSLPSYISPACLYVAAPPHVRRSERDRTDKTKQTVPVFCFEVATSDDIFGRSTPLQRAYFTPLESWECGLQLWFWKRPISMPVDDAIFVQRSVQKTVFSFAVSRTRRGTDFSDVSPANQVVSALHTYSSRCTTTPSLFWSSNQPKRCSNDFAIVDRSLDQITVSVPVSVTPRHGLTFRGSPTMLQCSVFNQVSSFRIKVQPSCSTCWEPRVTLPQMVAIFVQSYHREVSRTSVLPV
jgi:hypothetical protein